MIAATPSVCCCCCSCCCIDGPDAEAADEESAGDVVELAGAATIATDADEAFETLPVAEVRLFSSEPIDSSRCHLELRAALI